MYYIKKKKSQKKHNNDSQNTMVSYILIEILSYKLIINLQFYFIAILYLLVFMKTSSK